MPIVNFLEKREFKLGEAIQLQGQPMEGFSIVYRGRCKVVLIVNHKRKNEVTEHIRGLKSKLPNFYFGKKGSLMSSEKPQKFESEKINYVKDRQETDRRLKSKELTRQFTFTEDEQKNEEDPEHCYYEGHVKET